MTIKKGMQQLGPTFEGWQSVIWWQEHHQAQSVTHALQTENQLDHSRWDTYSVNDFMHGTILTTYYENRCDIGFILMLLQNARNWRVRLPVAPTPLVSSSSYGREREGEHFPWQTDNCIGLHWWDWRWWGWLDACHVNTSTFSLQPYQLLNRHNNSANWSTGVPHWVGEMHVRPSRWISLQWSALAEFLWAAPRPPPMSTC